MDPCNDTDRNKLFEKNKKLCYYMLHKALRRYPFLINKKEDLEQELMIALWRALETWYPEIAQLSTYYSYKAMSVVLKMVSDSSIENKFEVPFDATDVDNSIKHVALEEEVELNVNSPDNILFYLKPTLYEFLKERDADILVMRFGLNHKEQKTYKELSQVYMISSQRIQHLCKKSIEKLKGKTKISFIKNRFDEGL